MTYDMIKRMIESDGYGYDDISNKINAFVKTNRLTEDEANELRQLLDIKHYQPEVLPEL